MRILGIDPGSRRTGVGIIEVSGREVVPVCYGVIRAGDGDFPERLRTIFEGVRDLVRENRPDEVAVESVFVAHNAASAIKLGQARGAAICAAIERSLPVAEYAPRAVKQAVVGRGAADKAQVQHMVRVLLELKENPVEDAADALAVALCHHHTRGTLAQIATARR
ncbi:crossover junction endodeoxyribonuclease RuvC [Marinihelvus fidelis]|uniref:Crossover junction endodeoxyribonuclease RuvC n=1 Tax=Marinihelvus fidelis TaxID=2613842 RepID=A0A5N0TFV3_9GAMM|nr:crossover junction endodeoxyribonuclease RuvC [Marinihelvus fidelis]KAA9133501.1 crossover junction endodeoxyribonuclease RuvC [Marinihelvus fidelis]